MTTGQKIAERRRLLGMSQEKLGEQMGVSRQAISKWEADAALPEVEKLAALSRLFGVTVGWLLGLEEEPNPAAADNEKETEVELSERQMELIEELVKRYSTPAPSIDPKWKKALRLGLALLVALVVWCALQTFVLINLQKTTDQSIEQLNERINNVSHQTITVPDYDEIYSYLKQQLENAAGKAAALASCQLTLESIDPQSDTAHITMAAKPHLPELITDTEEIIFTAQSGSNTSTGKILSWDGTTFTGEITVPIEDDTHYFLRMPTADGTAQFSVDDDSAYELCDLKDSLRFDIDQIELLNVYTGYEKRGLRSYVAWVLDSYAYFDVGGYDYYIDADGSDYTIFEDYGLEVKLDALCNGKVFGTEILTDGVRLRETEGDFDLPSNPKEGDEITFRFTATLKDGRTATLNWWTSLTYTGRDWQQTESSITHGDYEEPIRK